MREIDKKKKKNMRIITFEIYMLKKYQKIKPNPSSRYNTMEREQRQDYL